MTRTVPAVTRCPAHLADGVAKAAYPGTNCDVVDGGSTGPAVPRQDLLCHVVGTWADQRGSTYKVAREDATSCSVRTERPSGEILHTRALIRLAIDGDLSVVLFGQHYRLDVESATPASVRWLSLRGRSCGFMWSRLGGAGRTAPVDSASCPSLAQQAGGEARGPCQLGPASTPPAERPPPTPAHWAAAVGATGGATSRLSADAPEFVPLLRLSADAPEFVPLLRVPPPVHDADAAVPAARPPQLGRAAAWAQLAKLAEVPPPVHDADAAAPAAGPPQLGRAAAWAQLAKLAEEPPADSLVSCSTAAAGGGDNASTGSSSASSVAPSPRPPEEEAAVEDGVLAQAPSPGPPPPPPPRPRPEVEACSTPVANTGRHSIASRASIASSEAQCFYIGDDDDLEEETEEGPGAPLEPPPPPPRPQRPAPPRAAAVAVAAVAGTAGKPAQSLAPGMRVSAFFYGEWHPAVVRAVPPVVDGQRAMVEVRWESEFSMSVLPADHVAALPSPPHEAPVTPVKARSNPSGNFEMWPPPGATEPGQPPPPPPPLPHPPDQPGTQPLVQPSLDLPTGPSNLSEGGRQADGGGGGGGGGGSSPAAAAAPRLRLSKAARRKATRAAKPKAAKEDAMPATDGAVGDGAACGDVGQDEAEEEPEEGGEDAEERAEVQSEVDVAAVGPFQRRRKVPRQPARVGMPLAVRKARQRRHDERAAVVAAIASAPADLAVVEEQASKLGRVCQLCDGPVCSEEVSPDGAKFKLCGKCLRFFETKERQLRKLAMKSAGAANAVHALSFPGAAKWGVGKGSLFLDVRRLNLLVELLLEHGEDPCEETDGGETPLEEALSTYQMFSNEKEVKKTIAEEPRMRTVITKERAIAYRNLAGVLAHHWKEGRGDVAPEREETCEELAAEFATILRTEAVDGGRPPAGDAGDAEQD